MEFDEEIFNEVAKILHPDYNRPAFKIVLKDYIKLANQKQVNLIDKDVCVSKTNDKDRLERIATAALTGILSNALYLDRLCGNSVECNDVVTLKIVAETAISFAKKTIAELDK